MKKSCRALGSDWTLRFQVKRFRNVEAKVWRGYCLALRPPASQHGAASSIPHSCLSPRKHQAASGCSAEEMAGPLFPSPQTNFKPSKQMAMLMLLLDIYFVAKLENSQENGKVTFFPLHKFVNGWHNGEACLLGLCETPTNCLCLALWVVRLM